VTRGELAHAAVQAAVAEHHACVCWWSIQRCRHPLKLTLGNILTTVTSPASKGHTERALRCRSTCQECRPKRLQMNGPPGRVRGQVRRWSELDKGTRDYALSVLESLALKRRAEGERFVLSDQDEHQLLMAIGFPFDRGKCSTAIEVLNSFMEEHTAVKKERTHRQRQVDRAHEKAKTIKRVANRSFKKRRPSARTDANKQNDIERAKRTFEKQNPTFACDACGRAFDAAQSLQQHKEGCAHYLRSSTDALCPLGCGLNLFKEDIDFIREHSKACPGSQGAFRCILCDVEEVGKFALHKTEASYLKHTLRAHEGMAHGKSILGKRYDCGKCGRNLTGKELATHYDRCKWTPIECAVAPYVCTHGCARVLAKDQLVGQKHRGDANWAEEHNQKHKKKRKLK
jgi:hypothetical protein